MSAITQRINSNFNFQPIETQQKPALVETRPLSQPYLGTSWVNTPSALNLFYIPHDFIATLRDEYQAELVGDYEGAIENYLRIMEVPFNLSSSLIENANIMSKLLAYFEVIKNESSYLLSFLKKAPILGIIMSVFEIAIELNGLKSAYSMLQALPIGELDLLERLKDSPVKLKDHFIKLLKHPIMHLFTPKELAEFSTTVTDCDLTHGLPTDQQKEALNTWREKIREKILYHTLTIFNHNYGRCDPRKTKAISQFVTKKFSQLAPQKKQEKIRYYQDLIHSRRERQLIRRIHSHAAEEFYQKLPQLITAINQGKQNTPYWKESTYTLLTDMHTQSQKKLLMNALGLLAVLITLAGLIAMLCACPYLIPLTLILVGFAFSCARYGVSEGMMQSKGWKLDAGELVPHFIKAIYRRIFSHNVYS